MKKIIKYIVILSGIFILSSCDKYVDIKPRGVVIPTKLDDVNMILLNSSINYVKGFEFYHDDDLKYTPENVDYLLSTSYRRQTGAVFTFQDYLALPENEEANYNGLYKLVGTANLVLQELESVTNDNQSQYEELKGEAMVHRAFAYFKLVNNYANQVTSANGSTTELGLPIILDKDYANTELNLTRATLKEVYDLIISDLNYASQVLPESQRFNFRPNKAAAYGMLAKVYLQNGNMEKAQENAHKALSLYATLLDYRIDDNIGSMEFDWRTGGDKFVAGLPKTEDHSEIIFAKSSFVPGAFNYSTYEFDYLAYLTPELEALFDKTNDIRYAKLVNADNNNYLAFNNGYLMQLGVTTPELYLIRAEANARLGNIGSAKQDIITLLTNRYLAGTVPDFSNLVSESEVLQMVLNERRKEMMFHGRRYTDIRRFNAMYNANIGITHVSASGADITLGADDPKWTWPIPLNVIGFNSEIKQNPRN